MWVKGSHRIIGFLVMAASFSFGFWVFRRYLNKVKDRKYNQRSLRDTSTLGTSWNQNIDSQYKDKCVGTILGLTSGDILGSALETESPYVIKAFGKIHSFPGHCNRYTDDTEMTLALMESINDKKALSAEHCSWNYGKHYLARPSRGYGKSASKILKALGKKTSNHLHSGYLVTSDGSWANGGAMRISPVALCFRNAPKDVLFKATRAAVMCTHMHPVGIDGSFVQAILIAYCAKHDAQSFQWEEVIDEMIAEALTDEVQDRLRHAKESVARNMDNISFAESFSEIFSVKKNSKGAVFQIRASDCVASVAFIVGKYFKDPEECVEQAITLGGDTDTIACMVGAAMGALYGSSWIPQRWYKNIENSANHGRDYLISNALSLSQFDFTTSNCVTIEGDESYE